MGTNYTLLENACDKCGRGEARHIGKSSLGWCFSLHVYPEDGINDLPDWIERWRKPNTRIVDEYGEDITRDEMAAVIVLRHWEGPERTRWFLEQNHAVPGPNGLLRSKVDGHHTIKHGEGTWDCHVGEFS